jgi:hypothetical protein
MPFRYYMGELRFHDSFRRCTLQGQCHEIFASGFYHESSSHKPLKKTLGSFLTFSKIRGYIRTSISTTGTAGVVDNGGALFFFKIFSICHRSQP